MSAVAVSDKDTKDFFKKSVDSKLIEKVDKVLSGLRDFGSSINRQVLELEQGYQFFDLVAKLGLTQFRRLMKVKFPYNHGDVLNLLSVAKLHQRFPNYHDKILTLGATVAKELGKASDELVNKLLSTAGMTLTEIKKIISREKKSLPISFPEELSPQFNVRTIVEIVKDNKVQGWLAEVTVAPDRFGRLTVRLLKTSKTRQFFLDEVRVYDRYRDVGVDPDDTITAEGWESLKIQYNLNDNNFESVKELAHTYAQQSASPEDTIIEVLWKHAFKAIDYYEHLIPVLSQAELDSSSQSENQEEEKTYSLAEVQAEAERAIAEYKRQIESEWGVKLGELNQVKEELVTVQSQLEKATIEIEVLRVESELLKQAYKSELVTELEELVSVSGTDAEVVISDLSELAVEVVVAEVAPEPREMSLSASAGGQEVVEYKDLEMVMSEVLEDGDNNEVPALLPVPVRKIDFSQSVLQAVEQMSQELSFEVGRR